MITANPSPQPEEYLPKIKEHLTAIRVSESTALERAIACGQLLASAKAALEEANTKLSKSKTTSWGKWLAENLKEFGIKLSTANVYIRLYEHKDDDKLKDAKSISEARDALPPERSGGGRREKDEDDDNPTDKLSDQDREQITSDYIRSRHIPELYDQLVSIFEDTELLELYQMLGQRFAKSEGAATAVANPPPVASKKSTPTLEMPGLLRRPVA